MGKEMYHRFRLRSALRSTISVPLLRDHDLVLGSLALSTDTCKLGLSVVLHQGCAFFKTGDSIFYPRIAFPSSSAYIMDDTWKIDPLPAGIYLVLRYATPMHYLQDLSPGSHRESESALRG